MFKLLVVLVLCALTAKSAFAGIVEPIQLCQAQGIPFQLRITDCAGAPPCNITPDNDIHVEVDFTSRIFIEEAHFLMIADTSSGPITITDVFIGEVVASTRYTAEGFISVSDQLSGEAIVLELAIYDPATARKAICIRVSMQIS